jgi:polyadenylate-binding protein
MIVRDSEGNSKGFGFVCFGRAEDAEIAYKEMKDQKLYEDLPPLYVNFAMKKVEREELLLKKRQESFKMSQKMTVYAKIKDESSVVK